MTATVEMKRNDLIQMMKDAGVKGWYRIYNKADMIAAINGVTKAGLFVEVEKERWTAN